MNGKEQFKEFVKGNPRLVKYVKNGEKSWQDFYEIYNLYGDDDKAWGEYLGSPKVENTTNFDLIGWLKAIDLDSIQNSVASIQRVLGVVEDFTNKDGTKVKEEYKPRPLYKHFED
ncbi:MAG: hypothetical protein J6D28_01835 [Bacilli bacterium]|nr:hypothetical protein [Bacilli bacterium]